MSQFLSSTTNKPSSSQPLQLNDLIQYFEQGNKRQSEFRIGLEHEKIGVVLQPDGSFLPLSYQSSSNSPDLIGLLKELTTIGWQPIFEKDQLIALQKNQASVTLEPGGQLEFSGAPQKTAQDATAELNQHLRELIPLAQKKNIFFLSCGYRPFGKQEEMPRVPKGRYQVMRQYLQKKGTLSLDMMHQTATVQANMDYASEQDAQKKFQLSLLLSPLVTALFAASPLRDGKPSGYQSFRAACWLDMDPDRCGIPSFALQADSFFQNYTQWALDVPMFFIYRDNTYHPLESMTFRQFLKQGWHGQFATLKDWDLHLSTLFPDTRLRTYLEMRSADAGPLHLVFALPHLLQGILYSQDASLAAYDLVKTWSYEELLELRKTVPQTGIKTKFRGKNLAIFCQEMLEIAKHGLHSNSALFNNTKALDPLFQIVQESHSFSDHILSWFEKGEPHLSSFLSWLTLKSENKF